MSKINPLFLLFIIPFFYACDPDPTQVDEMDMQSIKLDQKLSDQMLMIDQMSTVMDQSVIIDQATKVNDQSTEVNDQSTEVNDQSTEVNDQSTEVNDQNLSDSDIDLFDSMVDQMFSIDMMLMLTDAQRLNQGERLTLTLTDQEPLIYEIEIEQGKNLRVYTQGPDQCVNTDTRIDVFVWQNETQTFEQIASNDDIFVDQLCSLVYLYQLPMGKYQFKISTQQSEPFNFDLQLEYLDIPNVFVTERCLQSCRTDDVIDCNLPCDPNFDYCLKRIVGFCSNQDFCNQASDICDNRLLINEACVLGMQNECVDGLYCFTANPGIDQPTCQNYPRLNERCLMIDDRCPAESFCYTDEMSIATCRGEPENLGDPCNAIYLCPNEAWVCKGAHPTCQLPICGNFETEGLEKCDDGNLNVGDGCDASCLAERRVAIALAGQRVNLFSLINTNTPRMIGVQDQLVQNPCQSNLVEEHFEQFEIFNPSDQPQRINLKLYAAQKARLMVYQSPIMPQMSTQGCVQAITSQIRATQRRDELWGSSTENINLPAQGSLWIVVSIGTLDLVGQNRAVVEVLTKGIDSGAQLNTPIEASDLVIRGSLDRNDLNWNRLDTQCILNEFESQNSYHYDYYFLSNQSNQTKSVDLDLRFNDGDGYLYLFQINPEQPEIFDVNMNPCLLGADAIDQDQIRDLRLPPQSQMVLVVSSFYPDIALGAYTLTIHTNGCGDGKLNTNEMCDDGNLAVGDACDAQCQIEMICGDGFVRGSEECDDGNLSENDGCNAICQAEPIDISLQAEMLISGELNFRDSDWDRPFEDCQGIAEYHTYRKVYRLTNLSNDFAFVTPSVTWNQDGLIYQYADPLNIENPNTCIRANDDSNANYLQSALSEIAIAPNTTVVLILSGFEQAQSLQYTLQLNTVLANRVDECQLISPNQITSAYTTEIYAKAVEADVTQADGFDPSIIAEVGFALDGLDPILQSNQWTWQSAQPNQNQATPQNWDEYIASVEFPSTGIYDYAFRISADFGRTWTYCDLDGSLNGYQSNQAGDAQIPGKIVINEVDYDNVGSDDYEFVELYNNGGVPISLLNTNVLLINGGTDGTVPSILRRIALDSLVSIGAYEYIVVSMPLLTPMLMLGIRNVNLSVPMQNDIEAVAIEKVNGTNKTILDVISYGGTVVNYQEGGGTLLRDSQTEQGSLNRCPNGVDRNDNTVDFQWLTVPSPGMPNSCP